jgi:hypothetical protein
MTGLTVGTLRVIIATSLLGSILVQVVMVPLLWIDLEEVALTPRIAFVTIVVLAIVAPQVCAVCIWMLLSLVRRGAVFSTAAFRYVNVIIGSVTAASLLAFAMAIVLAPTDVAPGIVGLICGGGVVIAGVALVIVVMRALLRQAIDRDEKASHLRSELDEVI